MYYLLRLIPLFLILPGFSNTYLVGKKYGVQTIQQTIDKSTDGDTILVEQGIYQEKNLVIRKSIYLKGIDYPVLDGEGKFEIVSIRTSHVTVDGFKIIHSGRSTLEDPAGIKVYNQRNVTIINNLLVDTFFGIYTQN